MATEANNSNHVQQTRLAFRQAAQGGRILLRPVHEFAAHVINSLPPAERQNFSVEFAEIPLPRLTLTYQPPVTPLTKLKDLRDAVRQVFKPTNTFKPPHDSRLTIDASKDGHIHFVAWCGRDHGLGLHRFQLLLDDDHVDVILNHRVASWLVTVAPQLQGHVARHRLPPIFGEQVQALKLHYV